MDKDLKELWYQKAIDILAADQDWRGICISIAKNNPEALCKAISDQPWMLEIRRIAKSEGKVAAIKYLRNLKQLSLKDAKELVEDIMEDKS